MCDETTVTDHEAVLERKGLSRRQFSALGASAVLAGCTTYPRSSGEELVEETVSITTADGIADAFFVHPAKGAHPGVIMWPDIAGLREAKKIMARRLASAGYAVLVVNPYYRSAPSPVMESFSEFLQPEGRAKVLGYRQLLTPAAITSDAKAYAAFLDSREEVDKKRGIGSNGYCMGGSFAVRSTAAVPGRVKAAASFHGGGLVTDEADSPHKLLAGTQANYLIAISQDDDKKAPADKDAFRQAAEAANRPVEIEVYPADHGWCVPDSPVFDPTQADRAFERMLALYAKL